ncbi:MAG: lipoprotein [Campylobacteraceae bacterium]|nr:lipoprotein [Campylobacteraceae bacterium]
MFHLLIIAFIFLLSGCGYKGDPKYIESHDAPAKSSVIL